MIAKPMTTDEILEILKDGEGYITMNDHNNNTYFVVELPKEVAIEYAEKYPFIAWERDGNVYFGD